MFTNSGTLLSGEKRWLDADGIPLHHFLGVSGFAEYTVVSARSVVRIDHDLAPEIAALFGCAVMTGVGAVVNAARVAAGESVAVFGLGGVGLVEFLRWPARHKFQRGNGCILDFLT